MIDLQQIYSKIIYLAKKKDAKKYLFLLSFAEASFFPIPPDVILIPMCLAKPKQAWNLALIATIASVLGGMFGYVIGVYSLIIVEPMIQSLGYGDYFQLALSWFTTWGFWAVFVAGFSPIPYKIFTIAAGAMAMNFPLFVLGSFIGRGLRFFLVALLVKVFGEYIDRVIKRYANLLGWTAVIIFVLAVLIHQF
jgi:membrane protein YqaA with SNARE-associated domain